jgi:hypothetical protein
MGGHVAHRSRSNVIAIEAGDDIAWKLEQKVLSLLRFPGMYDRENDIEPAYKEIFK